MSIFQKIQSIISGELGIDKDEIKLDSSNNDLGMDSIVQLAIVMKIEYSYGISIPDERIADLKHVSDYVKLVEELTA